MEATTSEKTESSAVEKAPANETVSQQQFKIVRVRKPDGTIVKVKRPISPEEAQRILNAASNKEDKIPQTIHPNPPQGVSKTGAVAEGHLATKATPNVSSSHKTPKSMIPTEDSVAPSDKKPSAKETSEPVNPTKSDDATVAQSAIQPTSVSRTERVLETSTKGARIFRGLHRLHKGSSRLIAVLAPQYGVEEWQDGDEDISDDSDDNDDGGDDEKYDSDDDGDAEHHNNGSSANGAVEMKGIAAATATVTPSTLNAPRQVAAPEVAKAITPSKSKFSEKTSHINEKEVSGSESDPALAEKVAAAESKNLHSHYQDWSRYIIWAIMIIFPLLFMVIGILVAFMNGKSTDSLFSTGTTQALTVAISIWPIIFAGVVAQSLRAYATYKVERGVRLMTLEQLIHSNSVASSIKQPFLLKRFNWITVALLVLWGLSPLATQAMQRITKTKSVSSIGPGLGLGLRFVNTSAQSANYLAATSDIYEAVAPEFNRLYSASFLPVATDKKYSGSDPYNNALIPILEQTLNYTHWQNTDPTAGDYPNYASQYGIPIAPGDNYDATYNITLSASYLGFTCSALSVVGEDWWNAQENTPVSTGAASESTLYLNVTGMSGRTNGTLELVSQITLNTTAGPDNWTPLNYSDPNLNLTWTHTQCTFNQNFLDTNVSCHSGMCYVYSVRPTNTTSPQYVDSGSDNWVTAMLSAASSSGSTRIATDTERYLMNYGYLEGTNTHVNLTNVTLDVFTENLSILMNTLWSIGFAPTNLTDALLNNASAPLNIALGSSLNNAFAPGYEIDTHEIYITNWGWLAALMLCSIFLLLAGIFSIWWDARTVSPDVLGFASTVVRKSKYVKLPPVVSAASGAERARALGDVRVMMQDVKPKDPVGRIALGTWNPNAQRLQSGRSYR